MAILLFRCRKSRAGFGRSPFRRAAGVILLTVHLGGCFRYVPVGGTPVPAGSVVSVAVNDRGRVALADEIGPGVMKVHGRFIESTDSAIVLSMSSVEFMDLGVAVRMNEERVQVPREFVTELREKRLSRSRTWLTVALIGAGLVAASFVAITGFGGDVPGDRPDGGGNGQHQ